jgi:hypothetical protein
MRFGHSTGQFSSPNGQYCSRFIWTAPQPQPVPTTTHQHFLYHADANEAEIVINQEFLDRVDENFGPQTGCTLNEAIAIFINFIVIAKRNERLPERGQIHELSNLRFSLKDLLTYIPVQYWPLPHKDHYPCSFCGQIGGACELEDHLRAEYPTVYERGMIYTEIQLQLAGLLSVGLQVRKGRNWGCPFEGCPIGVDKYSQIADHVLKNHSKDEASLYSRVGGFWASLLWHIHQNGRWPDVEDIFVESRQARVELVRLSCEEAEAVWRPRAEVISPEIFNYTRPTAISPLDNILIRLRETASAPHSIEVSATGEYVRKSELIDEDNETEADTSEVIDALFKNLGIRNRSQKQRQPLMPRISEDEGNPETREQLGQLEQPLNLEEQEDEPDTEHEGDHRVEESMNLHYDVDPVVFIRMQRLMEILMRGSEETEDARGREIRFQRQMTDKDKETMVNDLEALLDEFKHEEIPPDRFAEVILEDPILLLLAQHRSFRICRSEFFCPEEGCRPNKPITSLGRLAIHLQTFHDATKEETSDMVRYFITKLLPGRFKRS